MEVGGEAVPDLGEGVPSFLERDMPVGTAAVNPWRGIAEDEVDLFSEGSSLGLAGVSSADPELLNVPDLADPICTDGTAATGAGAEDEEEEEEEEGGRSEGVAKESSSS